MDNELIDQGLTLMLAGMGTVFVFLTALVVAISGTSSNDDLRGGCYGR
jgi:Na+-transporting methylmalonyl-CoA/oxaloacetate decarboxylase gamma subunit